MDLELWAELSAAISQVERRWTPRPRDTHPTSRIVRVHLWSVLHERPTAWACVERNWTSKTCPPALPHRSRMHRRMAREDFERFLTALGACLNGKHRPTLLKIIDGHALELPNHSGDRDARWGRGVSRQSLGYKLHLIDSGTPMPAAFAITSLEVCEKQMAARLLNRTGGGGYLLADAHYDASWLFDHAMDREHRLLCPRAKPGTGVGHHYQSPHRRRAIDALEPPANVNDFGPRLYAARGNIERRFSGLCCFGGGLRALPPWVRRIWRVRRWVWGKLLIDAARTRIRLRSKQAG